TVGGPPERRPHFPRTHKSAAAQPGRPLSVCARRASRLFEKEPAMTATVDAPARTRRISGFTPSGSLHLGNYLGGIRQRAAEQARAESLVFTSDRPALTTEHRPADVHATTLEIATLLLAAGVDPTHTTLYVQSHLAETSELHYLLECATAFGEAQRM